GKGVRGGTVGLVLGEGDTVVGAHVGEFAAAAPIGVGLLVQDEGVHDPQEWDEIGVHTVAEQFVVEQAQVVGGVVDDQGQAFRGHEGQRGTDLGHGLGGRPSLFTHLLGGDAVDVGGFQGDVRTRVDEPGGGDLAAVTGVDPPQGRGDDPIGGHVQTGRFDVE